MIVLEKKIQKLRTEGGILERAHTYILFSKMSPKVFT